MSERAGPLRRRRRQRATVLDIVSNDRFVCDAIMLGWAIYSNIFRVHIHIMYHVMYLDDITRAAGASHVRRYAFVMRAAQFCDGDAFNLCDLF